MTIADQFLEQSAAKLAAANIEPIVQHALQKQAAVLLLSAIAYKPLSISVRVDDRLDPTIEAWLDFEAQRRLLIKTSWPQVRSDANGPIHDTMLISYRSGEIVSLTAISHLKAPDLVKVYLAELGL